MGRKPGRMHVKGKSGRKQVIPLTSWQYRGIITFVLGEDTVEYMSLFTADGFEGTPIDCNEGVLEWVEKDQIPN